MRNSTMDMAMTIDEGSWDWDCDNMHSPDIHLYFKVLMRHERTKKGPGDLDVLIFDNFHKVWFQDGANFF